MIPLLERYGIPYSIENSSVTDTGVTADEQLIHDCGGC
jgi:hypothetical protein